MLRLRRHRSDDEQAALHCGGCRPTWSRKHTGPLLGDRSRGDGQVDARRARPSQWWCRDLYGVVARVLSSGDASR